MNEKHFKMLKDVRTLNFSIGCAMLPSSSRFRLTGAFLPNASVSLILRPHAPPTEIRGRIPALAPS
jgi:hypothetical protein